MAPARPTDPWGQVIGRLTTRRPAANARRPYAAPPRLPTLLPRRLPQVEDLDGTAHYSTLGLEPRASAGDIKKVGRGLPPPPPPLCRRRHSAAACLPTFSHSGATPAAHGSPAPHPPPPPQAYRALAKRHHPDKGGDPAVFARVQAAFEVLGDPKKREVYDTWAKELQYRRGHFFSAAAPLGLAAQ